MSKFDVVEAMSRVPRNEHGAIDAKKAWGHLRALDTDNLVGKGEAVALLNALLTCEFTRGFNVSSKRFDTKTESFDKLDSKLRALVGSKRQRLELLAMVTAEAERAAAERAWDEGWQQYEDDLNFGGPSTPNPYKKGGSDVR